MVAPKFPNGLLDVAGVADFAAVLPKVNIDVAGAGVVAVSPCVLAVGAVTPFDCAPNVKGVDVLAPNIEGVPAVAVFDPKGVAGGWELASVMLPNSGFWVSELVLFCCAPRMLPNSGFCVSEPDEACTEAEMLPNRSFDVDALSCAVAAGVVAPNLKGDALALGLLFVVPNKLLPNVEEDAAVLLF